MAPQRADSGPWIQARCPGRGNSPRGYYDGRDVFDNPLATAAAIDRIVHHSVILEFDVPSYRTDAAQNRRIENEKLDPQKWLTWITTFSLEAR